MAKKRRGNWPFWVIGLMGVALVFLLRKTPPPHGPVPDLTVPDLNLSREAGSVERLTGSAVMRPAQPSDLPDAQAGQQAAPASIIGPTEVKLGSKFFLGTFFSVSPKSMLQIATAGNWLLSLEDGGEFVFEDARTNEAHNVHTGFWFVKKGTFRAKPHDYDQGDHFLEVRTIAAKIFLEKAEIGMDVSDSGKGRIWANSGKVTIEYRDGQKKELGLKGLESI